MHTSCPVTSCVPGIPMRPHGPRVRRDYPANRCGNGAALANHYEKKREES
ncbi:MAG TPA: hypothetical protein VGE45_19955 [Chloroflexia bacterium]